MKMSFRGYGEDDPVTLTNIRQIPGIVGIVSAIYDILVGEVWPIKKIEALKAEVEKHGLKLEVIESVPVHEDIKRGTPSRETLIDNYCQNIRHLAKCGIKVICYNFMPVFDWTRSTLNKPLPDGSTTLAFDTHVIDKTDIDEGLMLPGWDVSYKPDQLKSLLTEYSRVDEEIRWQRFEYFLRRIIRPDHGRMIWGETGKPGYGLYDRALGAVYLNGLREAFEKSRAGAG